MKKKIVSTELFKDKVMPPCIKDHSFFKKEPIQLQKVFSSVGLANFQEKVNIDKCLVDLSKEGSYVFNLVRLINSVFNELRTQVLHLADRIQFLETPEVRQANRDKMTYLYSRSEALLQLSGMILPSKENINQLITSSEGKITLRIPKDIMDLNGKILFKKDRPIFRIYQEIADFCADNKVIIQALDQTEEFKVFSRENMPNKGFNIVFSSDGTDGAWDIATMSMRGIKSCQRWDGEYPMCLVGSIISKFVGVMYLTSGAKSEPYRSQEGNGVTYSDLGTKMIRRCVVRYVIDADEKKPCILLDKMYPEPDKDVLKLFIDTVKAKTDLPVYYSPEIGSKSKHMYIPSEEISTKLSDRNRSYQDTPLKSSQDLKCQIFSHHKEEIEKDIKAFEVNLALYLSRELEDEYNSSGHSNPELYKIISNIRMNSSFSPLCASVVRNIIAAFKTPSSASFATSKDYYRKYLMDFFVSRNKVIGSVKRSLPGVYANFMSREIETEALTKFFSIKMTAFIKKEVSKLIS